MIKPNKLLTLILLWSLVPINNYAQNISEGYHGLIEAGYSVNPSSPTVGVNWPEINTIHGYQVNANLFIGAGVGFHFLGSVNEDEINGYPYWKREASTEIPIFANFKWIFLKKKISPFVDLRLGHYITNNSGIYELIGFGCRFSLKDNQAINVQASYSSSKFTFQELHSYHVGKYDYRWGYKDFEESQNMVSIKLGYEF